MTWADDARSGDADTDGPELNYLLDGMKALYL